MNLKDFPDRILSPDEENAIAKTPKDDDGGAREKLIMHNMREALPYSKKCSFGRLTDGDLVSVCYLGLRDASANFSPNRIRFFAYSKPYIRGRVYAEFRSHRVVKKSEVVQYEPDETEYVPMESEYENFPEESIQLREEWGLLAPLVREILSDKERMILELRHVGGFNFRQIGDLFAVPVSRSHVQHTHGTALKKIRAEMVKRGLPIHYSK